jgi:uncharacterized damage-inducible protein DinB
MTAPTVTIPMAMLFDDLETELAASRRLLERFPDEHADWKPHAKSASLAELATHIAELPQFGSAIASKPEWNVGVDKYQRVHARTRADIVALHDRSADIAREALGALDADALEHEWRMHKDGMTFFGGKRGPLLRRMLFSHIAHHRGQLSVYYRMLDVPVPGMYGPSADDVAGR